VLKKLVESTQSDPELIEENLAQLADDTDHLIRFIETLLELARAGMIIKDRTDISIPFLVKSLIEKLCPGDVPTEFIFQPAFPLLKWDPTGVEQVFSNLVRIAAIFMIPQEKAHHRAGLLDARLRPGNLAARQRHRHPRGVPGWGF